MHARCETKLCSGGSEARRSRCPVFCSSLAEEVNVSPSLPAIFFPTETTVRQPQHGVPGVRAFLRACVRAHKRRNILSGNADEKSRLFVVSSRERGGRHGEGGRRRYQGTRQSSGRVHRTAGEAGGGGRSARGWGRIPDGRGRGPTRVSQLGRYSTRRRRCIMRAACSSTTVAMIILFTGGISFGNRGRPHILPARTYVGLLASSPFSPPPSFCPSFRDPEGRSKPERFCGRNFLTRARALPGIEG